MEPLNKKDKRLFISNVIVGILLAGVLMMLLNLSGTVKEDGFQCLNDPLGFGATQIKEANDAELFCTCSLAKPGSPTLAFDSNSKSLTYPKVIQSTDDLQFNFNLSNLQIITE